MEKCSPDESILVDLCLTGDRPAWEVFFRDYKILIHCRIRAVLVSMRYSPNYEDLDEVFDLVVDRFFIGKALHHFHHQGSLVSFIKSITANTVIDWVRSRTSQKKFMGLAAFGVDKLANPFEEPESASSDNSLASLRLPVTGELRVFAKILLLRYFWLVGDDDLAVMLGMAKDRTEADIRRELQVIETNLANRAPATNEKFQECAFAFVSAQVFLKHGSRSHKALERAVKRRDNLMAEYRVRGFDDFPTRAEISRLLGWDVNKVDRTMRKLKEALSVEITKDSQYSEEVPKVS